MAVDHRNLQDRGAVVDIKVYVPELTDINPFWIRRHAVHQTFEDLYQECLNHPEVLRSRTALTRVTTSRRHVTTPRHFWYGDRMMFRKELINTVLPNAGGTQATPGNGGTFEISLVLRPDYYHVAPRNYLRHPDLEYTYLDAERPVGQIITQILSPDERACCFDLCRNSGGRRLTREKSLVEQNLWPAWQDALVDGFPSSACLRLRPHTSRLAQALLALAALLGMGTGFCLMTILR